VTTTPCALARDRARSGGDPDKSYVAQLFAKGNDAILKKIGEEATEVVMAAKDGDPKRIVAEVADVVPFGVALAQRPGAGRRAGGTERREGCRGERNLPRARHKPATRRAAMNDRD
jgi:phosphoribosyl-ATP pyrophosphohydrolase